MCQGKLKRYLILVQAVIMLGKLTLNENDYDDTRTFPW